MPPRRARSNATLAPVLAPMFGPETASAVIAGELDNESRHDSPAILSRRNRLQRHDSALCLDLFWGLFLIEFIVTWIQYMAEGQLDPWHFAGRFFRHSMTAGFIYLMITRGFVWMMIVLNSFTAIGQASPACPILGRRASCRPV